jgi:hypothetical protein
MSFRVAAALIAPLVLVMLFVATTPIKSGIPAVTLWAGYYAVAHLCFWPPLLLTMYLGRRIGTSGISQLTLLMGLCSLVMVICVAVIPREIAITNYHWRQAVLDSFPEAIAASGAFVVYRALRGLGKRSGVSGRT